MLQNAAFEYGHFAGVSSKQFEKTQIDPGHFDTLAKICEKKTLLTFAQFTFAMAEFFLAPA